MFTTIIDTYLDSSLSLFCHSLYSICQFRGRFKNTYEFVNLGHRKFSLINKLHSFQYMARYVVWNFKGNFCVITRTDYTCQGKQRGLDKNAICKHMGLKMFHRSGHNDICDDEI